MNTNSDVAEQMVRLTLEGYETTLRLTGEAAKNIAILLIAVLKEEKKTGGKARISNLIRSGKELKIFSLRNQDLKKFTENAKQYGVLYTVLKEKHNNSPDAVVDIIARAEDAAKIDRIIERFSLAKLTEKAEIHRNPISARTDENPLSEQNSEKMEEYSDKGKDVSVDKKPSVKQKLDRYKSHTDKVQGADRSRDENKVIPFAKNKTKSEVNR